MEAPNIQSEGGIYEPPGLESSYSLWPSESVKETRAIGNPVDSNRAFTSSTQPDEDWTKASDLAERRRIQNRIAQRNYRKKIKERMADLEKRVKVNETTNSPNVHERAQKQTGGERDIERHGDSPSAGVARWPSQPEDGFYGIYPPAIRSQGSKIPPVQGLSAFKDDVDFEHRSQADPANSLGEFAKGTDISVESRSDVPEFVSTPSNLKPKLPHSGGPKRSHKRCIICRKSFQRPSHLRRHLDTHTGEGLFEVEAKDDRSRFDSSDYESDDAGYVSGTETGFGDTKDLPRESSTHGRKRAVDDERPALPGSKKSEDDLVPRVGSKPFSQSLHDRSPATVVSTGSVNLPQWDVEEPRQDGAQDENAETGDNGERRRPRRAAAPTWDFEKPHPESSPQIQRLKTMSVEGPLGAYDPEVPTEEVSDTADDMSLRSFTESVFDIGSVLSSVSSSYSNSHTMVASFVDILLRDPNMDRLLAITISEFGVSSGRFTRNFSKILKSYSRHLRRAIDGLLLSKDIRNNYVLAAKAVCNSRHHISNLIASRYNERHPTAQDFQHRRVDIISRHLNQMVQIDNEQPSSNEESGGDEADFTTTDLKQFLVSGEPFWLLKRNLRSLIIPDEFLDCIYESARAFLDLLLTERPTRSIVHGLRHALLSGREIQSDLSMQIRIMAAELRKECIDVAQLDASIFLETYSEYISVIAIDHINTTFTSQGQRVPGSGQMQNEGSHSSRSKTQSMGTQVRKFRASLLHEDLLEQIVAETLPSVLYVDLVPHWRFIASSTAFLSFVRALQDLVYPTFFSKAKELVRATIRSSQDSDDKLALEGLRLLPILTEMETCSLTGDNGIHFLMDAPESHVSALDRVKIWIEASTAAEWDWWPMQPPNRPRSQDMAEMSWKCSCGAKRKEPILTTYANELQSIFNNFPLSRPDGSDPPDRPPSSLSHASSQGVQTTVSTGSSSTDYSGKQTASSSPSSPNSTTTLPDDVDDIAVDFSNGPRRYIYVFLLVKASEYILETIDVSSMTARDFFQTLRATYKKHRSLWRRALSVFVYNHCDFIKIIKPEPDVFMPGDLKFELPPDHDDEYYYRPRPTYSAPVSRHMFRHYFYGCYKDDSVRHRLHTCLPLAPKCRVRKPAGEMLDFFPKRDRPVATSSQSEKVEVCYGIAARECRSFFRVVVYLCLIMAPAFWFVFAWLFMWGDRGDLQDATVPMTLMLAMLSILWAVVHSGSDVRKEYADGLN